MEGETNSSEKGLSINDVTKGFQTFVTLARRRGRGLLRKLCVA